MTAKAWKIKDNGYSDDIRQLSEELTISPVITTLLIQRGIRTFDQAKKFFRPELSSLYDPFLMKDMDKAVTRLESALKNEEKILVYGDYDVDGTTSVAMMYSFIRSLHDKVDYAIDKGISLIIALDCGIKAVEKVTYAKEHQIDFIICDHHTPGEFLPAAIAVLNPERRDENYPFKYLSGCGVGFKFLQAFALRNQISFETVAEYLDLVAVSIASDIVPLVDENRILAHYGLKKLNESPSVGLKAI